ncbi:MAG TPA: prolyl oligopeptidase family serine peptidase [Thermoanaerobaculaceae bacterium]|nr:prolyl oligopeptidase family serine peptidase [Thermoanaerobaculaceae bacterium]
MPRSRVVALWAVLGVLAGKVGMCGTKVVQAPPKPPEVTVSVERWMVLGPVAAPLPVFAGEKRGGYGVSDLLKTSLISTPETMPAAGRREPWLGGSSLEWQQATVGKDGLLVLAPASKGTPQVAWLATQAEARRWQSLSVELQGTQARRLLVDGKQVAATEKAEAAAEAKGTVKLLPGTHLLVVQTVLDPARGGDWKVGLRLKAPTAPEVSVATMPDRDLDILDVLDRPDIGSAAISPDGELVAVSLKRIFPATDDSESWLEVWSVRDGALRWTWRGTGELRDVAWAAPGRLSYISSDRTKGKDAKDADLATLWLADLATGSVAPVIERVEGLAGYRWAGGGSTVVFWTTAKAEPDKRGVKVLEGLLDRQRGYRDKSYLWLARHPGGGRVRLTAGELSSQVTDISRDGARLLFTREVEDLTTRPFARKELWELDLGNLAATRLRDCRWLDEARYGPDGSLLIVAGPSEFGSVGVSLPAGTVPNEGDGQLYLWDPKADKVEPLSRDFDPAIGSAEWSPSAGAILVRATVADEEGLYRLDPASRRFTRLDVGSAVVSDPSLAENAPLAAVTGSSPWQPERLAVVDLATGTSRVILDPSRDWYPPTRQGRIEAWGCTVASGVHIAGRVYLPPDFDRARSYPAIVNYYAGTTPVNQAFGGRYPKEWWASRGYVVYVPQPSGATGFGQAYSARHVNEWGSLVVDEIVDATKQFLAAHPFVDAKRVGCIGASYGGFTTMALVTRTDLFAAAVSHAGISSISSYWGEGTWGYSYNARSAAGSFPWNRKDLYVDQSPLFSADKVRTPILLTHGGSDTNVPVGESDSFYTALKLVGAPVEYLQVEGQDHWILDHAKRVVWSRAIVAWFDRFLKAQPEWWEDTVAPPKKDAP